MDPDDGVILRGYYVLARYQPDPIRGEFRNVAVLFVDEAGVFQGLRSVRPGTISRTIEEHGLVANLISGIERRLGSSTTGIDQLREITEEYSHSVVFSEPRPAMVSESPQKLLDSLYLALVAPKAPVSVGFTKGHVLDHLSRWMRTIGATLEIGGHQDGHTFDGILRRADVVVYSLHVSSFAARQLNARKIEEEAGHFLFAAPRVATPTIGVIQPAPAGSAQETKLLQQKISCWFEEAGVPTMTPTAFRASLLARLGSRPSTAVQLELAPAT
jgi:hypothetical protein